MGLSICAARVPISHYVNSFLSILQRETIIPALKNLLAHELDRPFIIAHLALMGEDRNGQFHILEEANLSG